MDLNSLMQSMLSSDSLKNIESVTGTSESQVKKVLSSALPSLLDGAKAQATNEKTAESFVGALKDHAKVDTSDISSFFSGIDLTDGGKIVSHLLGSEKTATTKKAASNAGISTKKTGNILSAAAPLLMSLLGQQTSSSSGNNSSDIGGLMGSLLSNVDIGSLLGGLLGGSSGSASESSNESGGGFLSGLMGLFGKKK
ncbi:MAG: DUF937 domain-containing protein [Clostridia bacterium]|nr:DUF937 domain-containing protein [Clostridia bacterium]MBP5236471.1 DUF937 domain-containing protein [Clostridia bacterium]